MTERANQLDTLLGDPDFLADLYGSESIRTVAGKYGLSFGFVQKYRTTPSPRHLAGAAGAAQNSTTTSTDSRGTIQKVMNCSRIIPLSEWLETLIADGYDPADYTHSHSHSAWDQRTKDGELVVLYANKFSATLRPVKPGALVPSMEGIDPHSILAQLREQSNGAGAGSLESVGDFDDEQSAFVISINDIQLGQSYNGGSKATIAQFYEYVELARKRVRQLRRAGRSLETLVVVFGGDLIEGCVIYGNQAFNLDMHQKQQVEGVIALTLHALDVLAPMFDEVKVLAARGNHGENRIDGKRTTLGDNMDTHCVEMAKLALARDPKMQHIEWVIADTEDGVWVDVLGWTLVTTHGDVYAKGVAGATTDKKAQAWMKNMAASRRKFGRLGTPDVLIGHHFHHDKMVDWGDCLFRQTPSQDRGSPYFEQATGEYSDSGMLSFVMTDSVRYVDERVLRGPQSFAQYPNVA